MDGVLVIMTQLLYYAHNNTDLSDQFIQPAAEQVLQLTSNLDHEPAKHTRSMFAIQ